MNETRLLKDLISTMLTLPETDRYNFTIYAIQEIALTGGSNTWEILQSIADANYLVV